MTFPMEGENILSEMKSENKGISVQQEPVEEGQTDWEGTSDTLQPFWINPLLNALSSFCGLEEIRNRVRLRGQIQFTKGPITSWVTPCEP